MSVSHTLSAEGLEIWRGDRCLCRNLSLSLRAGQALHLQGANGTGKTTLIRVLAGLGRADGGEVRWNGQTLRASGAEYRSVLAYLGHSAGLKLALTPRENLAAASALLETAPARHSETVLTQMGLAGQADLPCGLLSMGQRRRAAMARVLLSDAPLWFLDEPLTSLDAEGVQLLTDLLTHHLGSGGLAVFASHQPLPVPAVHTLMLGGRA